MAFQKMKKKRISMTDLQDLAKKIEKENQILAGQKLRMIILLHFSHLGYEIYYDK